MSQDQQETPNMAELMKMMTQQFATMNAQMDAQMQRSQENMRKSQAEAQARMDQQFDKLYAKLPNRTTKQSYYIYKTAPQHHPKFVQQPSVRSTNVPSSPLVKTSSPSPSQQQQTVANHAPLHVQHSDHNNPLKEEDNAKESIANTTSNMLLPSEVLPSDCNDSPSTPKSMEISRREEKEQPMVEANQRDTMKPSPTPQLKEVQEQCKQPLHSCDQNKLLAVLHVHDVPNQEREDRVQRLLEDTQGTNQQSYKRSSYITALYKAYMYYNSFFSMLITCLFAIMISWNRHARSGVKLLLYDLRFEVESLQEREYDAGARGPTPILRQAHVYPSFMDQATRKTVIKKLFLDSIGLNYEMQNIRDEKAHETRPETMRIQWIDQEDHGSMTSHVQEAMRTRPWA